MARFKWNQRQVDRLLHEQAGPVGTDLRRKAEAVQRRAQELCAVSPEGSHGNPPGHLRDSIGVTTGRDEQGAYADIGTDVDYALPVELGSRPHVIRSKGDYPLRGADGTVYGREVNHPGTPAQPFLRPAVEAIRRDD